ncbi:MULTISPECIES: acetyl-CoA carboxylase biotin carboxylase subunit [Lactobacillus]|uniref:Biotin carboxylase n=1 Tax=Lactobacillus xujianguonis TaxID=2495899 RepID=A0A437STR3_9LACO|nr:MULTISPECIES: acetyl-CoA carboxylase biotin carboxylase subunit [Lactobacillus]RVU70331.1 acetyl-CoA carboxylase biotin carboxylase subunit [Lactobacillus xujianguonis]RVU76874.1 acetyl-CoA carboxylase biotin carboxylase subunit [Lactobacillus xujianguonis]
MFKKVLVANRGEIAVRIIRSLREMGIKTVAIYSTADKDSLHVQLADEAVCVGGPQPSSSYLNIKNILAAAVGTGAEAIHPGYGFLSESADFAKMCQECGLTFIGPKAETIDLMGNKEHARQMMIKHGVPVTPGSESFIDSADEAKTIAAKIGYPVLLKAAAGGGGKGIRQVARPEDMAAALASAQSEAKTDFGDDRMYLEKVMQNVKHIEVQIFRDQFGQTVYFPERDCSLQRNKQKVLEESPCDLITDEERAHLGQIAVQAAEAADYVNTGTIEFLMDQDHHFYFMEMNTRIQVEHTVTEMVTGVDLVKAQIQVASGEKLPFTQADLKAKGHAIECRINAEDPENNFMPSVGKVDYLFLPIGNPGMRIDTALYQNEQISPFYDSMLAKVVAFGRTRAEAIAKMKRLLHELILRGIHTNQEFHLAILNDPGFIAGNFTNTYLEKEFLLKWKESLKDEAVSA